MKEQIIELESIKTESGKKKKEESEKQNLFLRQLCIPNPNEIIRLLPDIDINYIYRNYENGEYNAFQIICSEIINKKENDLNSYKQREKDYIETAKIILQTNINLRYQDPNFNCQAIDFAIFTEECELIQLTLNKYEEKKLPFKNIDLIASVLNFNLPQEEIEDKEYMKIIKILLERGIEINTLDYDTGEPPIYLAAKHKSKEIVTLLLNNAKNGDLDLDYYVDSNGKSSRDLIMKYNLYDGPLPQTNKCRYHLLYKYLQENNSRKFIEQFIKYQDMSRDKKCAFLFRALQLGVYEIVEYILNEIKHFDGFETLLLLACVKGLFDVVDLLLKMKEKDINYDIYLVRRIVKAAQLLQSKIVDHNQCLELILCAKVEMNRKIDLNLADRKSRTVLEYAIERKQFKMILTILKYGASFNTNQCCLVLDIDPKLIQSHFDDCVSTYIDEEKVEKIRTHKNRISKQQCSYSIDLTSILSPKTFNESKTVQYKPEMIVLEHISSDPEYRQILLHPLVLVFIAMKWYKIRYFFFFDAILYFLFAVLLNIYIFSPNALPDPTLYISLTILISIAILWELIQITVFWRLYLCSLENWFKILVLFFSTLLISFEPFHFDSLLVQINAVSSFLSFITFFFVIGHFPALSTSVIMIRTVYTTLLISFLNYSTLYIAFVTSLYILLQDSSSEFRNYWLAMFKTIVMSTGEYESSSFDFHKYPVSYVIVTLFILMISIGLLNLLTGLAVSDIQNIKDHAELFGLDTRVRHIARMEKIFLRSGFINFCKCFKYICIFADFDTESTVEIDSNKKTITIGRSEDGSHKSREFPIDDYVLNVLKGRRKLFKEDKG